MRLPTTLSNQGRLQRPRRAVHGFLRLLPAKRPIRLFLPLIFRRSKGVCSDLATRLFGKTGNLLEVFNKEEESHWPNSPWVQAVISGLKKVPAASARPIDQAKH